jgi:MFS family permease
MEERKQLRIASLASAFAAFIVYLFTLAPSVGFIDSGELAAVAHGFGIAHPTGYPLYSMLAGLWAKIPIGSVIYRLNLLSAVLCAAGVGMFVQLIWMMLGIVQEKVEQKKKKKAQGKSGTTSKLVPGIRLVASVFAALVIGFSETYWATALTNEVYPLHVLFISLLMYFFIAALFVSEPGSKKQRNQWLLFALLLGLSFTNHMTTVLLAPAFLIVFFWRNKFSPLARKQLLIAVPAFLAGLLPYLYLPLRAAAHPFMNWGNPQIWETFIRHISGKQYQVWIFSGESTSRQFKYFFSSFPMEFAIVLLVFVVVGLGVVYSRHKQLGAMLWMLFVTCLLYSINYDIYDIDSYFLLTYIVTAIWAGFGFMWIAQRFLKSDIRYAAAMAAIGIGILIGVHWTSVDEGNNYLVEDYTKNMFQSVEKNAVVISFQWDNWVSASMYYQQVEGLRPDIVVLDKELFRRSWYLTHIEKQFPHIYSASAMQFTSFAEELVKFERDLPYDPRTIENKYNALINSIVDNAYATRPVYMTIEMEQQFAPGYIRIPEGLAFRVYKEAEVPSLDKPIWDDFTFRPLSRRGRLIDAMNDMYANMLVNRGILYFNAMKYSDASGYFQRAVAIYPESRSASVWLAKARQMTNMSVL